MGNDTCGIYNGFFIIVAMIYWKVDSGLFLTVDCIVAHVYIIEKLFYQMIPYKCNRYILYYRL